MCDNNYNGRYNYNDYLFSLRYITCKLSFIEIEKQNIKMSLSIKKVLISDKVDKSCQEVLARNNIDVDYKPGLAKEELIKIIKVNLAYHEIYFIFLVKIKLWQKDLPFNKISYFKRTQFYTQFFAIIQFCRNLIFAVVIN